MKILFTTIHFLIICTLVSAQSVEVQGELKVTTVNQNNAGTDVLVRNGDGTVAKRDASTIGGLPSTAIVLSELEENAALTNVGFSKTGIVEIPYGAQGDATTNYGKWLGPTSLINAPIGRHYPTSVWTGTEMIIWSGRDDNYQYVNTGAKYNPNTNTWNTMTTIDAPSGRIGSTAIWTGTEMIIWGGTASNDINTGAKYNPATNTWTTISNTNAPSSRSYHPVVWTNTEMIIWGGNGTNTGGKYNPTTDNWTSVSTINSPTGRSYHTSVWTGTEMIIWGGYSNAGINTGGKYDPLTDTWTGVSTANEPSSRNSHVGIWTSNEMIIWGGNGINTGGKYNPLVQGYAPLNRTIYYLYKKN